MALPSHQERRRFCKDDKVEVRSEEEGFKGSWHRVSVIETESLDSQIKYVIKYDEILTDDGSDCCVDSLLVNDNEVCQLRGHIRPLPPPHKIGKWDLLYGMCVDVYYHDCWWEGVVFDFEDGSEKRNIFFPDLGDDLMCQISDIRFTHDWNDVTGTWKIRGTWLFLQLLEEFENEGSFDKSPTQIWFDLRQKEKFQKLGEWTSGDIDLWKILVSETLSDKLKPLTSLSDETCLRKLQGSVESGNLIDINVEKCQSDVSILDKAECVSPLDLSSVPQNQDVKSDACSSAKEEDCSISCGKNKNGKFKRPKCRHTWLPAGLDMVPGAELCPDAVLKYLQRTEKIEASIFLDIKKHLLQLGWKIEYSKEESFRKRYTSPDGKLYYSLRQVCLSLNEVHSENISSTTQDENGSLFSNPNSSLLPLSKELPENHVTAVSSTTQDQNGSLLDIVYVEPEYCPEAAADWYRYDNTQSSSSEGAKSKMEMISRARKHLSALGWQFRWVILCRGRRELRYFSPEGKTYYSLRMACRDAIESCANACTHEEGKVVRSVNVKEDCQKKPSLRIKFKIPFALQKSKVGRNKKVHRKKKLSLLLSSSSPKQADLSGTQCSFSNLRKIRKTRGLIRLQNKRIGTRNKSDLRTSKRVKQISAPTLSVKKPLTVVSWLIDNNIVLPRTKVLFCSKSGARSTAGGRLTRDGIKCNCCFEVYALSGFTFHVSGKHHSPAATVFLEDGRSLLECQNEIIQKKLRNFAEEPPGNLKDSLKGQNDNICSICQYGGELLLCDQCPSSFHKSCLDLADVPDGDWFCPSCCCKICGHNKLERDPECSAKDDAVLNCTQCEQKYHIWCIRNRGKTCLKRIPKGNWFCNKKCKMIFSGLGKLIGKPIPVGSNNLTWTLLKPNHSEGHKPHTLSNKTWIENFSKLNIAVDIMHECFENVEEPYTKRDLLKDVIFNKKSELKRLNFEGFYTVVLQKDDEFVSAATIRVHGEKVAELPLVGTRFQYRRLGMCRILMNVLEKKLRELGVHTLILPAVPSVLNAWTGSFGFSKLMVSDRLPFVDCTFLDFQSTVMCYKQLMKMPSPESCLTREILPRLDNIYAANCDTMDLEGGLCATSDVFQAVDFQAGTLEQGQADVTATSNNSHAEEPINPQIMLNSESETCAHQQKENNSGISLNMETGHRFGGLKVYTRRSAKFEINTELKYYKRRRLNCK